jgi:outer membrane protein assembly factor BamB
VKWIVFVSFVLPSIGVTAADWTSAGQNIANTRNQSAESRISPKTAPRLTVKWEANLAGDVSATPTVDTDSVYVADMSGKIYRIDRTSGATIWSNPVSLYTGVYGDTARVSPVVAGSMADGAGAHTMFALDAASGDILWSFPSGGSVNGGSAVVDDVVYWGSGYGLWGGRSNHRLFAFELN